MAHPPWHVNAKDAAEAPLVYAEMSKSLLIGQKLLTDCRREANRSGTEVTIVRVPPAARRQHRLILQLLRR
jgi:hypothetical protein